MPAQETKTPIPPPETKTVTEATGAKSEPAEAKSSNGKAEPGPSDSSPESSDEEGRTRRPFSNTRADSPQAKSEQARQGQLSIPPAEGSGSTSRWLILSLVIAALILAGRVYLKRGESAPPAPIAEPVAQQTPPTPAATEAANAPTSTTEEHGAPSATEAAPAVNAAPSAEATAPAPAESAAASAAAPDGTRTVIVKLSPPGARLFYHGKPVPGSSPLTIELPPGQRRAYEVGMPGWVTRRLVVDGTKPEVFIGLKPEK